MPISSGAKRKSSTSHAASTSDAQLGGANRSSGPRSSRSISTSSISSSSKVARHRVPNSAPGERPLRANQRHKASEPRAAMNSLAGQRVVTRAKTPALEPLGLFGSLGSLSYHQAAAGADQPAGGGQIQRGKRTTTHLLGGKSYLIGGAGGAVAAPTAPTKSVPTGQNKQSAAALGSFGTKSRLEGSQAALLNQSMSLHVNGQPNGTTNSSSAPASAASSLADLHNLHNHHHGQPQRQSMNISKRVNLKYVKGLVILLMSLDLLITVFVHQFATHDQLTLSALTTHKLRFSLLNLILSSLWFIVLSGAIIFDVYSILIVGCLVHVASFILLLVCSVIHFTHRIDYNTVSLTAFLLLLFSIIVLHVYLLVLATLTAYLMLAVKRRKRM